VATAGVERRGSIAVTADGFDLCGRTAGTRRLGAGNTVHETRNLTSHAADAVLFGPDLALSSPTDHSGPGGTRARVDEFESFPARVTDDESGADRFDSFRRCWTSFSAARRAALKSAMPRSEDLLIDCGRTLLEAPTSGSPRERSGGTSPCGDRRRNAREAIQIGRGAFRCGQFSAAAKLCCARSSCCRADMSLARFPMQASGSVSRVRYRHVFVPPSAYAGPTTWTQVMDHNGADD